MQREGGNGARSAVLDCSDGARILGWLGDSEGCSRLPHNVYVNGRSTRDEHIIAHALRCGLIIRLRIMLAFEYVDMYLWRHAAQATVSHQIIQLHDSCVVNTLSHVIHK